MEYFSTIVRDITLQKRVEEELQTLSRQLLQTQEGERRRLAYELHDEISQVLTAIKINLQTITRTPHSFEVRMKDSIHLVEDALQQVRRIALDLRPPVLDDLGLAPALRWYVDQQIQRTGLSIRFAADPTLKRPSPDVEIAYLRIAQEALTNMVRHAQAQHVRVDL